MGKSFFDFLYHIVDTLYLFYKFLKVSFRNKTCFLGKKFKKAECEDIHILANGSSLKMILENGGVDGGVYCAMNFFGNTKDFFKMKPRYYCLADPMFVNTPMRDDIRCLFSVFNEKVNWDITLYIDADMSFPKFQKLHPILNKHINVVPVNLSAYEGFHSLDNVLYEMGIASPIIGTVAVMCIFVSLKMGYKKIHLYGVDHNFFDGMFVDEKNALCVVNKHFYGETIKYVQGFTTESYIEDKLLMFKGHRLVAQYAEYKKAEILNHTKDSWIDVYKKC